MTIDEMKEYIKCSEDTKYFLETYVKVTSPEGLTPVVTSPELLAAVKFASDPSQRGILVIDGERQVGKTTIQLLAALNLIVFGSDKTIHINTFRSDYSRDLIERLIFMYKMLPVWMQPTVTRLNKDRLTFENGCDVTTGSNLNAIKGKGINLLLFDESAFDRNFEETFTAAVPAITIMGKAIVASTKEPGSFFNKLLKDSKNKIEITRK